MTTAHPTPLQATYRYRTRNFNGTYNLFHVPVRIVAETLKSYTVELARPMDGLPKGHRMTVRKHNVIVPHNSAPAYSRPDYTDAWWNQ